MMENFKRGEVIEVRSGMNEEWYKRIFVYYVEGAIMPFVTVIRNDEEKFLTRKPFDFAPWRYACKLTKPNEEGINGND